MVKRMSKDFQSLIMAFSPQMMHFPLYFSSSIPSTSVNTPFVLHFLLAAYRSSASHGPNFKFRGERGGRHRKLRAHTLNHKHKAEIKLKTAIDLISKHTSSDILPPARLYHPNLPKQGHQQGNQMFKYLSLLETLLI